MYSNLFAYVISDYTCPLDLKHWVFQGYTHKFLKEPISFPPTSTNNATGIGTFFPQRLIHASYFLLPDHWIQSIAQRCVSSWCWPHCALHVRERERERKLRRRARKYCGSSNVCVSNYAHLHTCTSPHSVTPASAINYLQRTFKHHQWKTNRGTLYLRLTITY